MRVIASALWLQKQTQEPIHCIWLNKAELNAPFEHLFEPIEGLNIGSHLGKYRFVQMSHNRNPVKRVLANRLNHMLGVGASFFESDFIRQEDAITDALLDTVASGKGLYIKTCRGFGAFPDFLNRFVPVKSIREQIAQTVEAHGQHTIGVHVRRTDHNLSIASSPTKAFIREMEQALLERPSTVFFLSTDDPSVEDEFRAQFGSKIVTRQKRFERTSLQGMQDAVIDLYSLSRTSRILGSYWSSFSDVAARLGNISLITVLDQPQATTTTDSDQERLSF